MPVDAVVLPAIRHVRGCHAVPAVAQGASTRSFRSWHPRTAQFLPHLGKIYRRLVRLLDYPPRHTDRYSKKVGAVGLEPTNPSLVRRNTARNTPTSPGRLMHLNCENHARKCPKV